MKDLTKGSEIGALFSFSLPILIGNIFQQCYNVADSIIVGRVLGKENLAAVGFCFQFQSILVALSMGLTLGFGIVISHWMGEKETKQIQWAVEVGFSFALLVSIFVAMLGGAAEQIVSFFAVPKDTAPLAVLYLRVIFLGAIPCFLYNALTNIMRGLGDSVSPVYCLIAATILNIVLDLWFVAGLGWGIAGAAYATVLSQGGSFLSAFFLFRYRIKGYRVHLLWPWKKKEILVRGLKIGIPSMLQQMLRSVGFLALQGRVNLFGSSCMAAYAAATKIDSFAQLPTFHFGQALSNFTAQNLGAKREDRAKKGFRAALVLGWVVSGCLTVCVVPFASMWMRFFTTEAEVIAIGESYLHIVALFYCLEATMQMLNGILLGYEKPMVPLMSTLVSLILMQVPAAYVLSATELGYLGIWIAAPIGWLGGIAIRLYYYRKTVGKNQ